MVRGSQRKSGKNQKIRESQGIQQYQRAKVIKDAERNKLLRAHCVQQFIMFICTFTFKFVALTLFPV